MSIFSDLKAIIGAVAGATLMFAAFSLANEVWLLPAARTDAREQYIADQAFKDQKAELERKGDDAKIQRMSDYDLCVSYLRHGDELSVCDRLKL